MPLALKTRNQFVQDQVAAVQAALPGNFSFPVGSIVRALVDADSSLAIWEESLIEFVLARTRLSTSTGADADSFVADFGLKRPPAVAAATNLTFARYTATMQAIVPVGATASSFDNTVTFAVYADAANVNYSPTFNGYVLAAGTSSILVPAKATTAGAIGNVVANTITVINSPITGIDTVNNTLAVSNGQDAYNDMQLRAYFVQYLQSLSKATQGAIEFAIENAQPGTVIEYEIMENIDYTTGTPDLGFFFAVIDDGTGNPPPALITTVRNAIDAVRGLTIRFDVYAVTTLTATIAATVTTPPNYTNSIALQADIQNAIETYVNLIPIGGTLFYSRLYQIIYDVIKTDNPLTIDQFNVTGLTLNGGTSNLVATYKQAIKPAVPTITIVVPT